MRSRTCQAENKWCAATFEDDKEYEIISRDPSTARLLQQEANVGDMSTRTAIGSATRGSELRSGMGQGKISHRPTGRGIFMLNGRCSA